MMIHPRRNQAIPVFLTAIAVLVGGLLTGAAVADHHEDVSKAIGLKKQFKAKVVLDKLNNPSSVSFSPAGHLTVCDSGNGKVIVVKDGKPMDYITGFATEHWKVDAETGTKRFKLGPLSAVWVDDKTLAVTDGGKGDGEETVNFYSGPGKAEDGEKTNSVPKTSDHEADKGEGNLTGMSLSKNGKVLYVCGQGTDAKTWVLACNVATKKLKPLLSADEHGIQTNSPMQTAVARGLLTLYSGAGGKVDGLIVQWNLKEKKPAAKWTLPGLINPMGMAVIPGTRALVVVENNWSLTKVSPGKLAIVTLPKDGGEAKVRVIADKLMGPVSCAFGPDKTLYIAQLGAEFDKGMGQVIAVTGFDAMGKKKKDAAQEAAPKP